MKVTFEGTLEQIVSSLELFMADRRPAMARFPIKRKRNPTVNANKRRLFAERRSAVLQAFKLVRHDSNRRDTAASLLNALRRPTGVNDNDLKIANEALATPPASSGRGRWRHKKRGSTYLEIGRGKMQTSDLLRDMQPMIIYRSEADGSFWVRSQEEFEDGRFERIP